MNLFFILIFLFVPAFSLFQLRLAGERLDQVSLVNVITVALFIFSFLGAFVLFYQLDPYRYNSGVQDKALVLEVLFYSSINIIFFLLGVIFFRKIVGFDIVPFRSKEMQPLSGLQNLALIFLFAFCVLVLYSYLRKLDQVAIIVALTEGTNAAKQARSDMGNSFSGSYHWYKLVMHDFGNLLTFTCFALWLKTKKIKTFLFFCATFTYSTFVAVMATQKGLVAWLLIGLFMVYFLVKKDGLISFKKLIPFIFLLIALLMVSYIYFMGSGSAGSALWSVFSRTFSGSISPAYFYLEFFPEHQDYLLGRTFPNPGGLMPYEPFRYTIEVMNWRFPDLIGSGVVGTAPTVFWGEAYANFGPVGIPIVAFIMGCLVALVSYIVSKFEINPLTVGFLVWLILIFKSLSMTGFSDYLYNIYIIVISLFFLAFISLRGILKLRVKRVSDGA